MANIKSSAKRDQLAKARYAKNKAERSALRTAVKKFDAAVAEGNKEAAVSTYKVAVKAVDKAAGKNLRDCRSRNGLCIACSMLVCGSS